MRTVEAIPGAHHIGGVEMLNVEQIHQRRARIEARYGTRQHLERKQASIGLTLEEHIALLELKDLDFLEQSLHGSGTKKP